MSRATRATRPGSNSAAETTTPLPSSCLPFQCGAGVCKASCTGDADCASPAVCTAASMTRTEARRTTIATDDEDRLWSAAATDLSAALATLSPQIKAAVPALFATSANIGLTVLQFALSILLAGVLLANAQAKIQEIVR